MAKLYNLAGMSTATTGTGTITLGSAMYGHKTFAQAGVQDGETVTYAIKDGAASEIGRGVYTSSGTTLTRTVLKSTNSDAAISLSGSAEVFITAAAEDFGPSPNLLINGDFQINQRAFAGGSLSAGAYGFDRWKAGAGGCSISISGYVVTLASGSIAQVIEPSVFGLASLASTNFTVSIDTPSVNMTVSFGSDSDTITAGSGRRSVTLTTTGGDTGNLTLTLSAGSSCTFGRVKIEVGSTATDWGSRSSVLEMELCQRYYQRYQNTSGSVALAFLCYGYSASRVFGVLPIPVAMRSSPTVTYTGASVSTIASTIGAVTSMSTYSTGSNQILSFDINHDGTTTAGTAYVLVLDGGTSNNIILSAEL